MKRHFLALAVVAAAIGGVGTAAQAVEFGVGPGGVYVGPGEHHHYYRDRDYGAYNYYGGGCRTVIEHRTNRFGEDVTVRRRTCD
jgi:hypothetical protein